MGTRLNKRLFIEIGHTLGLRHIDDVAELAAYHDNAYSLMSYQFPSGKLVLPSTPMVADIAAVQSLYGANSQTRTGNSTYGYRVSADVGSGSVFDLVVQFIRLIPDPNDGPEPRFAANPLRSLRHRGNGTLGWYH